MERIGDAVAVPPGTTERPGEQPLRQSNQFFYVTGVVEPRAIVVIDGRTKNTTLFLQPFNERREQRMFGPGLIRATTRRGRPASTRSLARDEFAALLAALGRDRRTLFTPFRPEVLGEASSSHPAALASATRHDPWDGRGLARRGVHRERQARGAGVRDEGPRSDPRRHADIKSPREIAVIREATRITGLAIMEAMRDARPGMYEYELQADAEFVFKKYGALRPVVFRADRDRHRTPCYSHYHRNTAKLAGRRPGAVRLRAGLQILPVGRHARLPRQRPLHAAPARALHYLPAALSGIDDVHQGPDAPPREIIKNAVVEDGRHPRRVPVHGRQDQGGGDGVRGALSHEQRQQPRALGRHGGARRRPPGADARTGG